jgi:hypothetical protein
MSAEAPPTQAIKYTGSKVSVNFAPPFEAEEAGINFLGILIQEVL